MSALREFLPDGMDRLPLDAFINCALYHPRTGYYCQPRKRVGHSGDSDFYTSSSLGPVFARLVVEAIVNLLEGDPARHVFVELGPESEMGILGHLSAHPFMGHLLVRPGENFSIPPEAVVFSNELFDAQPFRRLVRASGGWKEMGVRLAGDTLEWCLLDLPAEVPGLPEDLPDGYIVDWPEAAHALMRRICGQPWSGLFLAFDYGLGRMDIFNERPRGTGRTYSGHRMGSDLLERPGEVDITCHLIWEEFEEIARDAGFGTIRLERQEAFFMHHASQVIAELAESGQPGLSPTRQTLMELINPGNMGHKFQVLSARRRQL